MYIGPHVKYPLFLSDCNETWSFSTDFRKIYKYEISLKIPPVRAELFHADGRMDRHNEFNSPFLQLFECAYKVYRNIKRNSME